MQGKVEISGVNTANFSKFPEELLIILHLACIMSPEGSSELAHPGSFEWKGSWLPLFADPKNNKGDQL